jgi:hypothetical protein
MAVQWIALPQEVRITVINHVRKQTAFRSCEQNNAIILTAGFKPSIKAKIMGPTSQCCQVSKTWHLKQKRWKERKRVNQMALTFK